MSTIFPGNYVAHLNAYRDQGVVAIPGVEFYRAVGAVVLNPDTKGIMVDGELPVADDYTAYILSPDLRQDDKPRIDKPMVIPEGAVVYRSALSAPGVHSEGGTVTIPTTTGIPAVTLTADADGFYPENGEGSVLVSILDGTALAADTPILLETTAVSHAMLNPSAGACRNSPSALIVEICYYVPAPAPDYDDVHIPYAVEAGQGT